MADPRDVLTRPAGPPDLTLAYGPHPAHVVDVRLPATTAPAPLVLVLHGGFWRRAYDRAHAGPQSEGLAAAGYVVATAEYRRTGMRGGGWPGTFDDVAHLVDEVPALVAAGVGPRVDVARTVLVGHSAGGHLAAWATGRHLLPAAAPWQRERPLPVTGVLALAGVLDLSEAQRLRLGSGAAAALLSAGPLDVVRPGAGARRAGRLPWADPCRLAPTGVPTVLLHGVEDAAVPVTLSRSYARVAGAELRELAGVGHFALIDPRSAAWPEVLRAVADLTG